jgi:dihydroxyacetone kinase-like predicted kinase
MNGIDIKNGDTIGIVGKEIIVANEDKFTAALALAKHLLGDDRFMLTIFCGINTTAEECVLMEDTLRASNPDVEIYTIDAGQDIYPYIFVAE